MHDLAEQIDAGIPAPPGRSADLDGVLRDGRRALRRRRLAVGGGAALAVVAVVGGSAWAFGPGGSTATAPDDTRLAGEPSAEPATDITDAAAHYEARTGELVVAEGWEIVERVEDPITGIAPTDFPMPVVDDSLGLALTDGSAEQWLIVYWGARQADDPSSGVSGAVIEPPGVRFDRFGHWLDLEVARLLSVPGGDIWGPDAAMYTPDAGLVTKPGWEVAERIDDVAGKDTLAVDVVRADDPDRHQWFLFSLRMTISTLHAPAPGYPTFQSWIEVNAPLLPGGGGGGADTGPSGDGDWPGVERDDLVAFSPGGALEPLPGVSLLEQRSSPDLPESFAGPDDVSAVALVEKDGERWFVLARDLADSPAQYIAVPAAEGGGTIAEFLELARERYAEGGGGLL